MSTTPSPSGEFTPIEDFSHCHDGIIKKLSEMEEFLKIS